MIISVCLSAAGAALPKPVMGITVYNDNFAVVKVIDNFDFTAGINTFKFTNVATQIDPTSVNFKCLSDPSAVSILEQNYEYDLVNTQSLLKRYIDKEITLDIKGSGADKGTTVSGVLSAFMGSDIILKQGNGAMQVVKMSSIERIRLDKMPDDLVTKPTLVWLASAKKSAKYLCRVTYTTSGISWKADYIAVLNEDEDALNLSGWVTINNKSGAAYKDAAVKLIAGDVRRVKEPRPAPRYSRIMKSINMAEDAGIGFEEKSFMEYHLYTLGRKTTINNNQVKQIEFITPAIGVPAKKVFLYQWQKKSDKVQIKIEFENKEKYGLGTALPKGKIRVMKKDPADGMLEFVGEDTIDHTARDEKLSLYIGNAFDITPKHKIINSKRERRSSTETHQIELKNHKDSAVTVLVEQSFPRYVNWEIYDESVKIISIKTKKELSSKSIHYKKKDAFTVRYSVEIPANAKAVLEYTANQTWP